MPPNIHGAYSLKARLTASSCSSSVKYSSAMLIPPLKTQKPADTFTDLFDRAIFLREFAAQCLHGHHPPGHLVIPQHERIVRAALVGALELCLETAAAQIDLQSQLWPRIA